MTHFIHSRSAYATLVTVCLIVATLPGAFSLSTDTWDMLVESAGLVDDNGIQRSSYTILPENRTGHMVTLNGYTGDPLGLKQDTSPDGMLYGEVAADVHAESGRAPSVKILLLTGETARDRCGPGEPSISFCPAVAFGIRIDGNWSGAIHITAQPANASTTSSIQLAIPPGDYYIIRGLVETRFTENFTITVAAVATDETIIHSKSKDIRIEREPGDYLIQAADVLKLDNGEYYFQAITSIYPFAGVCATMHDDSGDPLYQESVPFQLYVKSTLNFTTLRAHTFSVGADCDSPQATSSVNYVNEPDTGGGGGGGGDGCLARDVNTVQSKDSQSPSTQQMESDAETIC